MDYHTGNNMDESHKCYYQRNQTQKQKYHMIQFTGNTDKTKKHSPPKKKKIISDINLTTALTVMGCFGNRIRDTWIS